MAADMHIHVFEGMTEDDLALFFCNHFGSKWEDMSKYEEKFARYDELLHKMEAAPNVWVGELSGLKAALFDDDSYIPAPVWIINDLIGEDLPVLDDALMEKIMAAFGEENSTQYTLSTAENVRVFLEAQKGKRLFTISW